MMHQKSILFFILLFYFGCNNNSQAPPPPYPRVTLSASESSIEVDNNVMLYVNVANMQNIVAISFEIMYDHSIIEIVMESGDLSYDQFTSDNFGPVVYSNEGVLSFVKGANNFDGEIFSVTIKSLQVGTTNVTLDKVNLIKEDGTDVSKNDFLVLKNIEITVIAP